MKLKAFHIRNFRRLKNVHVEVDPGASIFVGANNSGKTSATHAFQLFVGRGDDKFTIHDFSSHCWQEFDAFTSIIAGAPTKIPSISLDLWFEVGTADLHRVIDLLPSLSWSGNLVGVRVEFAAKNPIELLAHFTEASSKARSPTSGAAEAVGYRPWPKSLTDYLSRRLSTEFEKRYYVLDRNQFDANWEQSATYSPRPFGDKEHPPGKILASLMRVDFLSAQRHMSDNSSSGRSEDLSKRLSRFYERNLEQRSDNEAFEAIRALANSEEQLNTHLTKVFAPMLEKLNGLGYPGFFDPHLVIRSALNPESILKQNAQVHYALNAGKAADEVVLPDKYNGLGFKNLIYMVVEVLDFHSRWATEKEERALLHVVIIEEPEAHLHAQLQQVFIREIFHVLPKEDPRFFSTQMILTTHSPHIVYESGFTPIRYFRRSSELGIGQSSDVLNLSDFAGRTAKETREFLQRYMKLTHCDLFFADAVVLVEGNVERLLLPLMIQKSAPNLQLSYLSILEVGGAFAHCFRELIAFLGLTTLVITDLDSVSPKAAPPVAPTVPGVEPEEDPPFSACTVDTADAVTSNQTLAKWLPKKEKIADLLAADENSKIQKATKGAPGSVRVCYQVQREVAWNSEKGMLTGRTLEEDFALANLLWCQAASQKDLGLRIRGAGKLPLADLREHLFEKVSGASFKKTEFALAMMTKELMNWNVPPYIDEGLRWLDREMEPHRKPNSNGAVQSQQPL